MLPTAHDAEHWRNLAREARAQAEQLSDPEAKQQLQEIAVAFEELAKLAAGNRPQSP